MYFSFETISIDHFDSLVALIKFERPDLMGDRPEHSSALTPLNPKENYWPRMIEFPPSFAFVLTLFLMLSF